MADSSTSSRIPDEVLEAIRTRVSIVDVVSGHVALRRTGKNWKGLCPFHGEKTPSFIVNEERGTYHCFGCGAGGTAFRFLMEAEGRSFREAVELLAARAGVALKLEPEGPAEREARAEREVLLEILELAARYYRHQLLQGRAGDAARAYLRQRSIDAEAAEAFRLGCAPTGWDNLARYLAKKGLDPALSAKAGLLTQRASGGYYDRFRARLMFPIADASGRVVSFGGRVLGEGEPKYLNGPESAVFRKSEILYGLFQGQEALRRERRALLVEGYIDVVSLHSRGFRPALASLGTSLTREHLQQLRRRVDEAVLLYDGDAPGRKAAFRSLELFLAEGLPCRAVILPPEHDPDSFVQAGEDLGERIRVARPLFAEYLDDLASRCDLGSVDGRLRVLEELGPSLRALTDPLARDVYFKESAERFGVSEALLRARVGSMPAGPPARGAEAPRPSEPLDPVERALFACLVHEPEHRAAFVSRGGGAWMAAGPLRDAALFVADKADTGGSIPMEGAPEAVRQLISQVLVDDAGPRPSYEILEAKLRLRGLEAKAAAVLRETKQAQGEDSAVTALQREKMELDRAIRECRKRIQG